MSIAKHQNTNTPHDATKPCRVCGEDIKLAARICTHCNNWQDWRAELSISNTVFSLLLASLSVLALAIPPIITAFTPENSNINFSIEDVSEDGIGVWVSNSGTRPGITKTFAILEYLRNGKALALALQLPGDKKFLVIEPGKSQLVTFKAAMPKTTVPASEISIASGCSVEFFAYDFRGQRQHPDAEPFDCSHTESVTVVP